LVAVSSLFQSEDDVGGDGNAEPYGRAGASSTWVQVDDDVSHRQFDAGGRVNVQRATQKGEFGRARLSRDKWEAGQMRPSCAYQVPEDDQGHDDVLFVQGQEDGVRGAVTSSVLRSHASQDASMGSRSHDDQAGLQSSSTGFSRGLVTEAKHNDTERTISRQPTSSSSNARPKITGWTVGEPAHDNDLNPACRATTPCLSSL